MAVLVVALFVFTPTVTAAGPGGGGAGDGGGLTCGYLSYLEPCDATGDTDRIKWETERETGGGVPDTQTSSPASPCTQWS